ncbi:DUF6443 domain-containing protein [Ekhidna sp.]|uniref:DUF6443 domain-containing protein n=1 Tax=Ekhidna sp. TaxID=2608089 RepID=UPI003C7E7ADE
MKRNLYHIIYLILVLKLSGQQPAEPEISNTNYVKSVTLQDEVTLNNFLSSPASYSSSINLDYYDGLGRKIQQVAYMATPNLHNLIQHIEYDGYGRVVHEFLPYVNQLNGNLDTDASTNQATFYSSRIDEKQTEYPYSTNKLEWSPLNRIVAKIHPGEAWQAEEKHIRFLYETNGASEVLFWDFSEIITSSVSYYTVAQLYKNTTVDEDGNITIQYTNKEGQTILKKSRIDTIWAETYYIYDAFGKLRIVLPPEATNRINDEFFAVASDRQQFLDRWAFQYTYDGRGRMIEKRVPGSDPIFMIYDRWNRLVLTQDGNQRLNDEWTYTRFDVLNRPIINGIVTLNESVETLRSLAEIEIDRYEDYDSGHPLLFTENTFPSYLNNDPHSVTYYDNYDFLVSVTWDGFDFQPKDELVEYNMNVKGNPTAQITWLLDESSDFIKSVTYYDDKYRVIQTISENHLGGMDVSSFWYDFSGNVLQMKQEHFNGTESIELLLSYSYDHANRLLSCTHKLNDDPSVILYANEYNELGELIGKNLHYDETEESYKQQLDYEYNIRGWLRSINESSLSGESMEPEPADLFSIELLYNTALPNQPNN